jgi:hypothetical protein
MEYDSINGNGDAMRISTEVTERSHDAADTAVESDVVDRVVASPAVRSARRDAISDHAVRDTCPHLVDAQSTVYVCVTQYLRGRD